MEVKGRGKLFVVEGACDGIGKSTQYALLKERLENDGDKVFLVSRGGVESGLEEAVLKLKKNSEAILILPSHLAHGLTGDGNRIQAKAILVYRIKVIDIK